MHTRDRLQLSSGAVSVSVALVLGACSGSELCADNWSKFLGERGDSTSSETNLVERWDASGPKLSWSVPIGTGYSAPSVRGNRLFVHHRKADKEIVDCLDASTGTKIWSYAYQSDFVDPFGYNNGPRATPLVTEDHCFTLGAEGKLLCLNVASGKKVWERDTNKEWTIPQAFFGVGSSPLIHSNKLVVMIGGQPNSGVVAVSPQTGKTIWESVGLSNWQAKPMHGWPGELKVEWKLHEKQASYASPVPAIIHGKERILCLMRQGLVAIDPSNGLVDDSFWFRARVNESVNASNPIVLENGIFISSAYYRSGSVMLDVDPKDRRFVERWRSPQIETHWMTPIVLNGVIYAFSGRNEPDARLICFDLRSAKLLWSQDQSWQKHSSEPVAKYGRGSIIFADKKLIVLGETGLLGIYKPNIETPTEVCRFKPPMLNYPCWTAPILSAGHLFLRSEEALVCYDLRAPSAK